MRHLFQLAAVLYSRPIVHSDPMTNPALKLEFVWKIMRKYYDPDFKKIIIKYVTIFGHVQYSELSVSANSAWTIDAFF